MKQVKKKVKTFCFDIDGVICLTKGNDYKNSKPNKKIIKIINNLYKKNKIVLHTARFMGRSKNNRLLAEKKAKQLTLNQLKKWKVNFHEIFFGKPSYDFVIDDKSIFMQRLINKDLLIKIQKNIY